MPPEFVVLNFNKIYSMEKPPFRTEASAFLVRLVEDRPALYQRHAGRNPMARDSIAANAATE